MCFIMMPAKQDHDFVWFNQISCQSHGCYSDNCSIAFILTMAAALWFVAFVCSEAISAVI